jgi:dihydroflavonol-4-reductase
VIFFLTGATGFLGSNIARVLLEAGHQVRAIRRSSSKMDLIGKHADEITWIEGDVLDPESLEEGMQSAHAVVHAAAFLGFEGKKSEEQLMAVNVGGTANVVDAAILAGIKRIVHVSSVAALGRSETDNGCRDESSEWSDSPMNTGYALSKHLAEMEIHRGIAMGIDAVMVNPSLVMGVGRPSENTMQIADRLVKGGIPFVPKGGTNVVDVRDVAVACMRAFESGKTGERYILAGYNLMWEDILATMSSNLGVKPPTRTLPTWIMMSAAALFEFGAFLARRRGVITRETIRLSMSISCYDNARSVQELGCTYRPFAETAQWIAEEYRALEG